MKGMIRLTLIIITGLVCSRGHAQQAPQFSQYMYNYFIFNPAVAGTRPYFVLRADVRDQWVGMEGHPRTQVASFHAPVFRNRVGIGGFLFNDVIGPMEKKGISMSYSYHVKVTDNSLISFGLSGSYFTSRINPDKLKFDDGLNTDNNLMYSALKQSYPNFGYGMYYQDKKACIGLSVPEILTFTGREKDNFSITPARHYYMFGEYSIKLGDNYSLTPSAMLKYVKNAPLSCEVNTMFTFFDRVNAGVSYRYGDAFVSILGYEFKNTVHVAYSYDLTATDLTRYTSGTHEISIGYYGKSRKEKNCPAFDRRVPRSGKSPKHKKGAMALPTGEEKE
jgi:type IX secretion system PorP/SprF family membrane protein